VIDEPASSLRTDGRRYYVNTTLRRVMKRPVTSAGCT